jgi:hypothetical protein
MGLYTLEIAKCLDQEIRRSVGLFHFVPTSKIRILWPRQWTKANKFVP